MRRFLLQQGDVLFHGGEKMPEGLKRVKSKRPGLVTFAEGEVTGHHHSCVADGVELYEDTDGTLWCLVQKETPVAHQEHDSVVLPVDELRIGSVREVDPFSEEVRRVAD